MKKKELFLEYLKKQQTEEFVSSTELAKILGVSTRSIRYYAKQLNEDNSNLIETSREGYRYSRTVAHLPTTVDSVAGRRFSILRRLLKAGDEGVDLFDLADELWVSESSIRQDMSALQELVQDKHLKIQQQGFCYLLTGFPEAKRELIMTLIKQQNGGMLSIEEEMQKFLSEISLPDLTATCQQAFSAFDFQPNRYFFQNFLLHLIIALHQKRSGGISTSTSPSSLMIEQIATGLFENHGVQLAEEDKQELALLCDSEQVCDTAKNQVSQEISNSLLLALRELSDVFLMDFTEKLFLNRLLLHMQNLYLRVKKKKIKRNLNILNIKICYPILFDMAVYLSSLISKDLNIEIAEDEIAFLSLHLGSFFDEQKKNESKIQAKLCVTDYLGQKERLQAKIETYFREELHFVHTDDATVDLIISSKEIPLKEKVAVIKIREFMSEQDLKMIRTAIDTIKQQRYTLFLKETLPRFFPEDAFLELKTPESKRHLFQQIGTWFYEQGITKLDYSQKLLEREKMATTAFSSGIALPHTIKYEGLKTGFLVLKPEMPLSWDTQKIHLILAFAVNPKESAEFNQIFTRIIEILAEDYHVHYLKKSNTRNEWIERLIELMTSHGYYE